MKRNPNILIAPWQPAYSPNEAIGIYSYVTAYTPEAQIWNKVIKDLDDALDVDFYYTANYSQSSISIQQTFLNANWLGNADIYDSNPYNGYFDIAINASKLAKESNYYGLDYYKLYEETATHEMGHALGLKHPKDFSATLPSAQDVSPAESIMADGYPSNFTGLDLAALIMVNGIEDDWQNGEAPVHRFYNQQSGGHFFTASTQEAEYVATQLFDSFVYEGTAFYAGGVNPVNNADIYRFYNTKAGGHFFTMSAGERDFVIKTQASSYIYEGVAFKASATKNAFSEEIYRFYNTKAGGHFFTADEGERDYVIATQNDTFIYEGIGFYA